MCRLFYSAYEFLLFLFSTTLYIMAMCHFWVVDINLCVLFPYWRVVCIFLLQIKNAKSSIGLYWS